VVYVWIPRWLGEIYSNLLLHFKLELFTFQQAKKLLSIKENKLAVAFSKLHSKRILLIFERKKPRLYRLMNTENFFLLTSEKVQNLDRLPQERYLQLICGCFRQTSKAFDIKSLAVYGSVARGSATTSSDVDILLICEDLHGSVGSRIGKLYEIESGLEDELGWLRKHEIYTGLSFYPLRKEEAKRIPYLFLDLTEEAVILYDEDRFLEKLLLGLKTKLLRQGAKRVFLGKDHWYWDLKPDYKFGEMVAIA
jgi:hypothetical protein